MRFNELRDHCRAATPEYIVAASAPCQGTYETHGYIAGSAQPFYERRDQQYAVAGALPANQALKPNAGVRGERDIYEPGDHLWPETQFLRVAGGRSTNGAVKPKTGLSSARTFPESGRHRIPETQLARASEAIVTLRLLPATLCNPEPGCGGLA